MQIYKFLQFAKTTFKGLSVTMPLKETVMPMIDFIDLEAVEIEAVNTLVISNDKISGFNTDGIGALNAIERECSVLNKHIVVLGAGGAAKAIAFEALRRGAFVTIVNRNKDKALKLAQRLNCRGLGLDQLSMCVEQGYDLLIKCTPNEFNISPNYFISNAIVMDIVTKPKDTYFLQQAAKKGCRVIYGKAMFLEQALRQFNLWF